jgi:DNA-binding NarL/FixJ family response regulator
VADLKQALDSLGDGDIASSLEAVGVEAFIIDTAGVVRWQNAAARVQAGEAVGRRAVEFVLPRERADTRQELEQLLHDGVPRDLSRHLARADGTMQVREISLAPLPGGSTVVGIFGLARRPAPSSMETPPSESPLTRRQFEILQLLAAGHSTDEIADGLVLSRMTVRNHIAKLLTALGAHSRVQAVALARRAGWIRTP